MDTDTQIFVSLTHPVNVGSVDSQSVVLSYGAGTNAGAQVTYVPDTCTLIFTVDDLLRGEETYDILLDATVLSLEGDALGAPYHSSFITAPRPSYSQQGPRVTVDPPGGLYDAAQLVTLTCDVDDVCTAIRYTTDGSTPGPTSPEYTGPISITEDTVLAYYAVNSYVDLIGPVVVQSYITTSTHPGSRATCHSTPRRRCCTTRRSRSSSTSR